MNRDRVNVAFLGGMFPSEIRETIEENSKSTVHYAANAFQWKFIHGLEECINCSVKLISRVFIGAFPTGYKSPWFAPGEFSHSGSSTDVLVGFCNVLGIRQLTYDSTVRAPLSSWANEDPDIPHILFVYSSEFSGEAVRLKRHYPNIHICLILPDLPSHICAGNKSLFHKLYYEKKVKETREAVVELDSFVLLTAAMKEELDIPEEKKVVIVEGIADELPLDKTSLNNSDSDIVSFAYTGTLSLEYGVIELIEAFSRIKRSDLRLVICGTGEGEKYVREAAKADSRIQFLGRVSPEKAREVQSSASVLVNPRSNKGEYTKYSFPSKLMEYLASGVPVLCYRLDGIPAEYDNYLFYMEDDSPGAFEKGLIRLANMTKEERAAAGKRGKAFVLEQRDARSQVERVLKTINLQ